MQANLQRSSKKDGDPCPFVAGQQPPIEGCLAQKPAVEGVRYLAKHKHVERSGACLFDSLAYVGKRSTAWCRWSDIHRLFAIYRALCVYASMRRSRSQVHVKAIRKYPPKERWVRTHQHSWARMILPAECDAHRDVHGPEVRAKRYVAVCISEKWVVADCMQSQKGCRGMHGRKRMHVCSAP
jgi:hypothetical protein